MQNTKIHSLRLHPDQDLKKSLLEWSRAHQIKAAAILSCVGSLKVTQLRLASAKQAIELNGPQEILSFVGNFSVHGGHFHISLADSKGQVVGGHLLDGNIINTTAEIVILEMLDREFARQMDPKTGYLELKIK